MAKLKGEQYKCDECGLVVVVENPCGCDESCELVCCQEPMEKVPAAKTSTATSKATAKKK